MPPVTSATAIRIECTNFECAAELVFPLRSDKNIPVSCPVCGRNWGCEIQAFRDVLMRQRQTGEQTYELHLCFEK